MIDNPDDGQLQTEYNETKTELGQIYVNKAKGPLFVWSVGGLKRERKLVKSEKNWNNRRNSNFLKNRTVLFSTLPVQTLECYQKFQWFGQILSFASPVPTISEVEGNKLHSPFNEHEFNDAECSMSIKKSHGSDGLSVQFYRKFWHKVKNMFLSSVSTSSETGKLTQSQRRGITLIEKTGKEKKMLKSWRPISLLNVDYKIISKSRANRIKPLLNKLIHLSQTGFVKGRHGLFGMWYIADYYLLSLDSE